MVNVASPPQFACDEPDIVPCAVCVTVIVYRSGANVAVIE